MDAKKVEFIYNLVRAIILVVFLTALYLAHSRQKSPATGREAAKVKQTYTFTYEYIIPVHRHLPHHPGRI